jgi:hypothetical protein
MATQPDVNPIADSATLSPRKSASITLTIDSGPGWIQVRVETLTVPDDFAALADAECGRAGYGRRLLEILQLSASDIDTALALVPVARGHQGESWAERRVAVLLLEHHLLQLPVDDLQAFDLVLTALGLKPRTGPEVPIDAEVLDQGFSTTSLASFVSELVRRLGRLRRVHLLVRRPDGGPTAWEYFLRAARDVSKLTLARYVFSAEEVVREVERTLVVTRGAEDAVSRRRRGAAGAIASEPLDRRRYEAEILRRLCDGHRIYWVSPQCGSDLNAMIENPIGSAVVVIKPPGSDLEIEIKRTGLRGPRLLQVITQRSNGTPAPVSHRLFGGSLGWLASREAAAVAAFSTIFHLVHGRQDPCSHTVARSSIVEVPGADGPVHLLDYLTDPGAFGSGFEEMRRALGACADSFPFFSCLARASYEGERGRTLQFIGQTSPEQAVLRGSSSFRLDRLALYLSDEGPEEYFVDGLGRRPALFELRWLADGLLEEIMGEIVVPPDGYRDYSQYVRDAFCVGANRERADRHYLSAMRQLGDCWGTLLGMRGFSDGESFVQRNVGLKSVWRDGDWRMRLIVQDHDDLTVAGVGPRWISPWREVSGMQRDEVHILGGPVGTSTVEGDAAALQQIYRIDPDVAGAGVAALKEAAAAAFDRGQAELAANRDLRALFPHGFLDARADYYELVSRFLRADLADLDPWTEDASVYLGARDYPAEQIATYTKSIYHFRRFFDRMRFLYAR